MSARAIVSGALFKAPQTKISKAGKPYAIATIREGTGERARWWKAFVFNESAIEDSGFWRVRMRTVRARRRRVPFRLEDHGRCSSFGFWLCLAVSQQNAALREGLAAPTRGGAQDDDDLSF